MRLAMSYLLLAAALLLARDNKRLTVDQLRSFLHSAQAAGSSDDEIARQLAHVDLAERLTDNGLAGLQLASLGPRTR